MTLPVDGQRLLRDLKDLAAIGNVGKGGSRLALTAEDMAARIWLCDRMEDAGLVSSIDAIGNVIGYTPGAERYLLVGSHTDTVPGGGWVDGTLGVMTGLEIARSYTTSDHRGPIGIGVVSFSDEEGTFAPLLGSRVFTGDIILDDLSSAVSADGRILDDARRLAGLHDKPLIRFDPARHVGFLEIHIEQGPILESEGGQLGIVTDIVGIGRSRVTFSGRADHAGTTPMSLRSDAAEALYDFATSFRTFTLSHFANDAVFNLGAARITPGAFNVVADRAELLVEYRSASDAILARIEEHVPALAEAAANSARATASVERIPAISAIPMSPAMIDHLEKAAKSLGVRARRMPSGAGHDAMQFAKLVPTGMLFIPSIGGRSHCVEEDSHPESITTGLKVMSEAVAAILEL